MEMDLCAEIVKEKSERILSQKQLSKNKKLMAVEVPDFIVKEAEKNFNLGKFDYTLRKKWK